MFESLGNTVADNLLVVLASIATIAIAIVFVRAIAGGGRRARVPSRRASAQSGARRVTELAAGDGNPTAEADGLESYRWAVAVREDALGPDHPDVATACHILGAMYRERARFAEAEPLLQRALAIRTRVFGPAHSEVALTIEDLADLYRAQGRKVEAESLLEGLRAIRPMARSAPGVALGTEASPVARTGDVATTGNSGAAAFQRSRERSDVESEKPEIKSPKSGSKAPSGPEPDPGSEELSRVLGQLSGLHGADQEPDSAQDLYRRALAMMEATGATDHPELRTVLRELGRLYYRNGAYAEAEPLLERALALGHRALGADASELAEIRDELAWLRFSRRSLPGR